MSKMVVKFETPEDIQQFVNIVKNYPYDMDLSRGKYIVDAKSLLGIMNLGLNNEIILKVYGDKCETLRRDIQQYIAA